MKVIAIQNYGPSGTMLLHSLFDGHPQVLSMPGLYPIGLYTSWREFASAERTLSPATISDFLMKRLSFLYTVDEIEASWGLRELGEQRDTHPCVDGERFRSALLSSLLELGVEAALASGDVTGVRRSVVRSSFVAYERALGRDTTTKTVIVYPAHSSELLDLRELAEDFPDIFFIHMIRDPVDGLFSTVKHNSIFQARSSTLSLHDPFACAVAQMTMDYTPLIERREPFFAMTPLTPELAPRCRAVPLEWLHAAPERTLRRIADWVGLEWDAVLLQSTFAGRRWWNRPGLRRLSGFNPAMARTDEITHADRLRVSMFFSPVRRWFGYEEKPAGKADRLTAFLWMFRACHAERNVADPLRHYALFVNHCLRRICPLRAQRAHDLLAFLVNERSGELAASDNTGTHQTTHAWLKARAATASRRAPHVVGWQCGVWLGRLCSFLLNRRTLLKGWYALRSNAPRVDLLGSWSD